LTVLQQKNIFKYFSSKVFQEMSILSSIFLSYKN